MNEGLIQSLGGVFGWHWCIWTGEFVWSFMYWPTRILKKMYGQMKAKNLSLGLFRNKACIFKIRRRSVTYYWWQLLLCLLYILLLLTGLKRNENVLRNKAMVENVEIQEVVIEDR